MNHPWLNGPPPTWSLIDELEESEKRKKSTMSSSSSVATQTQIQRSWSLNSVPSNSVCYTSTQEPLETVTRARTLSRWDADQFRMLREIEEQEEEERRRRVKREQMEEDSRLARLLQEEEAREAAHFRHTTTTTMIQNNRYPTTNNRVLYASSPLFMPTLFGSGRRNVVIQDEEEHWCRTRRGIPSLGAAPPVIKFEVPKRFVLSKKSWSWGGEMYIRDVEIREEIFRVKGKLLSMGARLKIVDLKGIEQAYIRQRVSFRKPYYEVWKWNTLALTLKGSKKNSGGGELAGDCYADGSRMIVVGRPKELDYELRRGTGELSHQVARVFSTTFEEYVVEVPPGEDVILVLAAALVVDRANQQPL